MQDRALKIGLFAIGLEAYWDQFDGLRERLENYLTQVGWKLTAMAPGLVNLGFIDTTDKAFDAAFTLRRENVDLIFLYATTYALSSTVLPVVQRAKVPVVVLNLAPDAAIDYVSFNQMDDRTKMTGEWLAYCSACVIPEIANVFHRAQIRFHEVTGILQESDSCWEEVREWIDAAKVVKTMQYNRLGCMGHYYSGMLDTYSDLTNQQVHFGGHIEMLEVDELSALRKGVHRSAIQDRVHQFHEAFDVQPDCQLEAIEQAARTSVALDQLVQRYQLGSLAYYYRGTGVSENEDTIRSIIPGSSLLTAAHVPVAGEYEIKNAQAMKILDSFGVGGSFTEFYALDYREDIVLMGHDGPGHIAIAQGKIKLRPLQVYHGKAGRGLSVEMSVRHGPVTLLSVVEKPGGKLMLLIAEGESVPGPILQIGNTNSRYKFSLGARTFVRQWNSNGPAHHCAVGLGRISSKLKKLGLLLDLEVIQVC